MSFFIIIALERDPFQFLNWRNAWKIIAKLQHCFKLPAIMLSFVLC